MKLYHKIACSQVWYARTDRRTNSSNKHRLILIIFGKQHQHTFRNDTHIQLSLSLHFYLVYLLSNSCNGNDAFCMASSYARETVHLLQQETRILSLQICVRQTVRLTRKPGRLQNLATDAGMCVHCTRHTSATPATWCSASVTHKHKQ